MTILFWLTAAISLSNFGNLMANPVKSPPIAAARDGDIAIEQELCAARKQRTLAAYDLFIARHPEHRLVRIATEERAKLAAAALQE